MERRSKSTAEELQILEGKNLHLSLYILLYHILQHCLISLALHHIQLRWVRQSSLCFLTDLKISEHDVMALEASDWLIKSIRGSPVDVF